MISVVLLSAITHHVTNKDFIQTIVKAANRKLRNRGKAKLSGSDGDSGPYEGTARGSVGAADPKIDPSLDSPPPCSAFSEEVLLDVKTYPAYHFDEICFLSTENAKPQFRRTRSDDCLLDSSPPARISFSELTVRPSAQCRFPRPFVSLCSEDPCAVAEQDKENYHTGRRYYYAI